MLRHAFRTSLAILVSAFFALPAARGEESRVVVELFTSQGCSSCPAADKLLGELAKDPAILPLSLSVDYWDYLGWKDTLALPGHAKRQRAYAGQRGDRKVYTPQMVIDGVTHVQGSDKAAIERAVRQARTGSAPSLPVKLSVTSDTIRVDLPAAKEPGQSGEVWLCLLTRQVKVPIGRGENRDKTVTYSNVVRGWKKLGDWSGAAREFTMPVADIASEEVDAVAVLVQAGKSAAPGRIEGAAIASLRQ